MRFVAPVAGLLIGYVVCVTFGLAGAFALVVFGIAYGAVWVGRQGHRFNRC